MNQRRFVLGSLGALLLSCTMGSAHANVEPVEGYLEQWQRDNRLPGVAAAVIEGDDLAMYSFGEDGRGEPVTADTPFLIGSVSKTFTSTMLLQLVEEGQILLDEEARAYLPWLSHAATVRQLLAHMAGYSASDGLAVSERYHEEETVTDAARWLAPSGEIGRYQYSSANYLVLGALVEQVTGRSFADELSDRITEPLGIGSTWVDGQESDVPPGSRMWWGFPVAYAPGAEPSGAPYGYLTSTMDDLVAYARAQLDTELLSPETQALAWSEGTGGDGATGYGLGWRIDDSEAATRIHHTGATPGFFAHLMLIPDEERAIIVLANGYSEARAAGLGAAVADIDRLSRGEGVSPRSGDPLLVALPWVMLAPLVLGILGLVGLRRGWPRTGRGATVLLGASVIVTALLAVLPMLLGMTWHVVTAWTPDVALGCAAGIAVWGILVVGSAVCLLRRRREAR